MRYLLAIIAMLAVCGYAFADPDFKSYPAGSVYSGTHAKPDLSNRNAFSYRTRLREAAKEKPNFAAEYVVEQWGCGTDCGTGAIVNVRTGQVILLPSITEPSGSRLPVDEFQFQLGSKLIMLPGQIDSEGVLGYHYFLINEKGLDKLESIPVKAVPYSDPDGQDDPSNAKQGNSEPPQPDNSDQSQSMIYMAFLCATYDGRPDLNNCDSASGLYQTKEACQNQINLLVEKSNYKDIVGQFHFNGLSGTRVLKCKGRPTWSDVN